MSPQAPQQIRLRRRLNERQIGLLYLPPDALHDDLNQTSGPAKTRKVFKLVKRDDRASVVSRLKPQPAIDDAPAEPPRYILTQSEPSRKRKIATFTAERPQKKLQAHDGSQIAVTPVSVAAPTDAPSVPSTPQRKRPGASTAISCKPSTENEDLSRAVPQTTQVGEDAAFKTLLEEVESGDAKTAVQPRVKHRFLPKATTRLRDRAKRADVPVNDAMDIDAVSDTEYVYDTYILDDAMDFDLQSAEPGSVGLLHIDEEQQPVWETYLDETDSEDEHASDDEDSNAEDYYGADYPEDELDFDEEYDVDAYKYRRNASDEEEYGPDDPEFSDAEEDNGIPQRPKLTQR